MLDTNLGTIAPVKDSTFVTLFQMPYFIRLIDVFEYLLSKTGWFLDQNQGAKKHLLLPTSTLHCKEEQKIHLPSRKRDPVEEKIKSMLVLDLKLTVYTNMHDS